MVKIVNTDGSTVEGSVEELLEIVKGLSEDTSMSNTNEIRVLGNTYEKVANKPEEGDYIVFEKSDVSYITPGRPYFVNRIDSCGDARVIDNDGDDYDTDGDEFNVYRKTGPKNVMYELTSDNTSLGEVFVVLDTQGNYYDKGDLVSLNDKLLGGASAEFKRNYDGQEQILSYNQVRRASR
ncbi:hypothetical protein BJM29_13110 [Listeria monocytogenes]|uniref:hypothetical protein n=1 Tax=Listeria monocytogenes TaxID=1639 RepID=UPI0008748E7D|nr:hypothetical protein [Listeria monocytogenes]EAF4459097.1 hypothetical protein [Listeria monocytogenes serotype 1/2a]OFF72355.1 hypothetical protein BJM29_13110 [Listeria monocytogenes]OFF89179.1 hypothetical protein BJM52_14020 [Listeria monocytogenes]